MRTLSLLAASTLAITSLYAQEIKPNIIVFVADDSGKDYGCYGNPYIKTPNIDKLASQGVRFEKAFVSCPQCSPSRTSMMTGMFAHTLGGEDLNTPIDQTTKMITSYLRPAGYYTGCMLKTHWGDNGTKQFDFSYNGRSEIYSEPFMTAQNPFFKKYQDFLNSSANKPFFLWIGFIDPHRPYKEVNTKAVHSPENVKIHPSLIDAPATRQDIADYYDEIHRLDQHVGFMLAELEKRDKMDNTVVIFLSDNGLPFIKGKAFLYDTGIETPLIVSWKDKTKQGAVHNNGMVSFIDIAPTILDIAGIAMPKGMYGESIKPLILDPAKKGREVIYAERNFHDTEDYARCIRTSKYKLIYNAYPYKLTAITGDMQKSPSWWDLMAAKREDKLNREQQFVFKYPRSSIELYDLEKDPLEFSNIADHGENVEIVRELLLKLRKWQKETKDTDWWEKERDDAIDRVTGMSILPFKPRRNNDLMKDSKQ
jgi:arylsulfatase A-like enzyme